jgi:hypothetical protein
VIALPRLGTRPGTRRAARLAVVAVTAGAAVLVAGVAAADTPPWQLSGNINNDPNAVGTLAFYDATGTQIFSGSTSAQPFAAYVAGSTTLRAGDTKAALFAYLPNSGTPAGAWTGSLLTAAAGYPNAAAPGALATTAPLYSGTGSDTTLADFVAGHPNTSSAAGYANVYELRLRTSAPGRSATPTYDVADVQVSGSTWQIVYPGHFTSTTTTLGVTPNTGLHAGASVTLQATVSDSSATGTVHFTDGSTALGADVTLSGGVASKIVKITTAGSHTFHATYVPDASSTFAGSTGDATVSVAKATTKTSATWPSSTPHYGTSWVVKAAVTATGLTPTGTVSVKEGSKVLKSATLSSGKASITLPGTALLPGSHTLTVSYGGSANAAASSTTKTVSIARAVSHVTNKLVASTIRKSVHGKLSVKVTATGTTPTGTVAVYDGTKKIATGTLSKGSVTITLPLLGRGKHTIHAKYLGSTKVAPGSASSVTLTVTS